MYLEFYMGIWSDVPHLFIQSFIYQQTDGYLFYTLGSNLILFYFAAKISQALAIESFQLVAVAL